MGYRKHLAGVYALYSVHLRLNLRDTSNALHARARARELREEIAAEHPTTENLLALAQTFTHAAFHALSLAEEVQPHRKAVALFEQILAGAPAASEYRRKLAGALHWLGNSL